MSIVTHKNKTMFKKNATKLTLCVLRAHQVN